MKIRKWLSVLLMLCVALSLVPVTAFADTSETMTWNGLQAKFNYNRTITLECDITAEESDLALNVPSGIKITLDLKGHTINRNLSSAMPGGSVFTVDGELTINDSVGGGTITGGYTTGYGGGILVSGTLTLNGGTITGNCAVGDSNKSGGGGVAMTEGGVFNMSGGAVTDNTTGTTGGNQGGGVYIGSGDFNLYGGTISGNTSSGQGAGVYVLRGSRFKAYGAAATVIGNTRGGVANNVYFAGKATLDVEKGDPGSGVIGVSSKASNGVILYLDNADMLSIFVSDNDAYRLTCADEPNTDGKYGAQLAPGLYLVKIDTGITGGTVTTNKEFAMAGETVTLTAVPDDDMLLENVTVTKANNDPVTVNNNSFIMPPSDVTVSATFAPPCSYWIDSEVIKDNGVANGRITINDGSDSGSSYAGQTVTITAVPESGYHTLSIEVWMNDEDNRYEYTHEVPGVAHPDADTATFTMPSADVMVYASFADRDSSVIFICDMEGGTVVADKTLFNNYGEEAVTLTIRPDNGYSYVVDSLKVWGYDHSNYVEFSLTYSDQNETCSFTPDRPLDYYYVSAEFEVAPEQPKYAVTIETDEMENGTLTAEPTEASEGWRVTLTAEPDTVRGYALDSLEVIDRDGNEYQTTPIGNNRYEFIMPACEVFASAVFTIPYYSITAVTENNGTGSYILVDSEAEEGRSVSVACILLQDTILKTLTVTDESGSQYDISLHEHVEGRTVYWYKFTMPAKPVTVTAEFEKTPYAVSADPSVPGTFKASLNGTEYDLPHDFNADDELTVIYTPSAGKILKKLYLSYTASSGLTVKLQRPFQANADGTYTASVTMPGSDVILSVEEENFWNVLQAQLDSARNGETISLTTDVTAEADDTALIVDADKTVTLDLNGHSIDRGLADSMAQENGCVIINYGTLTIIDTSAEQTGTITGGNCSGDAGCIYNSGTLTITGGSITGNAATLYHGGGIYTFGTLTLTGGSVTGNTAADQGGGILIHANSNSVNIEGNPVIVNNTAVNGSNIYLRSGAGPLSITGTLGTDARIGVALARGTGTVTNSFGTSGNGPAQLACFVPDSSAYMVGIGNSNEVILGDPVTVSFDPVVGSGNMDSVTVARGSMYTLPECSFTPPESYQTFTCWSVNGTAKLPGNPVLIEEDTTVDAVFSIYYIDRTDGSDTTVSLTGIFTPVRSDTSSWGNGNWYAVIGNVTIGDSVTVTGTANLILCDGAALTVNRGILVTPGNTLNIYGQDLDSGTLTARGSERSAGIGGANRQSGGTINIHGGTITAIGNEEKDNVTDPLYGGAGIGGGSFGDGGSITIYGGIITATGSKGKNYQDSEIITGSAGIGGGYAGDGGSITICGGTIDAAGGYCSAGIGGGSEGETGTIIIRGGTVTAGGEKFGAAIGAGERGKKHGSITISGGTVKATGIIGCYDGTFGRCPVLLSWTNTTDSITADQYWGKVTLEKNFKDKDNGTVFTPGTMSFDQLYDIDKRTIVPYIPVTINGVSGSFNDKIKLNYYFDLPELVLADEDAYVTITNERTEKSVTLPIKYAEFVTDRGYKFSIPLAAKEASDTITAKIYAGNGNALTILSSASNKDYTATGVQYTLMDYFTWLESDGNGSEKSVGKAAKDYCAAAQIYFNYHADGLAVSSAVDAVSAEDLSSYIAVRAGTLPAGVSIRGITALLESDNTLRLYLGFSGIDPTSLTYAIDGNEVELCERSDGSYYLALDTGVRSNHLQDTHDYSISDGTNTYTITASVLTYARSIALKSKEAESNLGKALYLYNQAAVTAFPIA